MYCISRQQLWSKKVKCWKTMEKLTCSFSMSISFATIFPFPNFTPFCHPLLSNSTKFGKHHPPPQQKKTKHVDTVETRPKIPFTPAKVPHRRRKLWSVPWPPFFGNHQQPDSRLITHRFQKKNEVISINAEKTLGSLETSHQFWIHWRRTGNTI